MYKCRLIYVSPVSMHPCPITIQVDKQLKSLGIKESQKNNDNEEGCVKEIPGRMWGFALYKEAINSDPGVTGMDLLYLPPPLPPANTHNTTIFSKHALHIDTFVRGWELSFFEVRQFL